MATGGRDERRLMRQRGAGTRNINNNIDFGLSFPTPGNARRSRTPSTNRRISRRNTKTPARRSVSQEPAAAAPIEISALTTAKQVNRRKSSFLDTVTEIPNKSASKRRKLNDSTATPVGQTNEGGNNEPSAARLRASRKSDFIAIAEEPSRDDDEAQVDMFEEVADVGAQDSTIDLEGDKENDEPGRETTKTKRKKKRKSIGQQRPKKRSSTGSLQEQQMARKRPLTNEEPSTNSKTPLHLVGGSDTQEGTLVTAQALPMIVRHQNGIAIPTKAPRTNALPQQATENTQPSVSGQKLTKGTRASSGPAPDIGGEGDNSILSTQSNGTSKKRRRRKTIIVKKRRGRRTSAPPTASASLKERSRPAPARAVGRARTPYEDVDEDEDESYMPEEISPEPPTPAVTRKRKNAKIVRSTEGDQPARRSTSTGSKQSGLPITTYRLANTSALPTIVEDSEAGSDDELQNQFGTSRKVPNAVDVLAQICRETVASALTATRTDATGSELKRRVEAIESFGKEMDNRLFDMSAAVENRLTLEARVRVSKREKTEVQARWLEVRRKREEVALRMDRVRREHWESEEVGAESWKLSEGLHAVEICLERETGTETESLEFLLKSVSAGVSGCEGGGVLQRVRDFNAQMERMVEVLDGRVE